MWTARIYNLSTQSPLKMVNPSSTMSSLSAAVFVGNESTVGDCRAGSARDTFYYLCCLGSDAGPTAGGHPPIILLPFHSVYILPSAACKSSTVAEGAV